MKPRLNDNDDDINEDKFQKSYEIIWIVKKTAKRNVANAIYFSMGSNLSFSPIRRRFLYNVILTESKLTNLEYGNFFSV